MSYRNNLNRATCEVLLGSRTARDVPSLRATRIECRDEGVAIVYHQTAVVTFTPDGIVLNSGGYDTNTTKARINAALAGTPYRVWSDKGVWHLYRNGEKVAPFVDGMLLESELLK